MNVVDMRIDDIIPYEQNPRNNEAAVEKVAESIKEFGFKVPIIIDKDNVIVAGHTRLKAAQKLKLEKVPVVCATDLTEEQVKAFRLADNKTSEFSLWDFTKLEQQLEEIKDIDMSRFGFEEDKEPTAEEADGGEVEDKQRAKIAVRINFPDLKTWREHENALRELVDSFDGVSVSVGEDNEDN